jgi:DNA-binding transcriptional LysR family regulator
MVVSKTDLLLTLPERHARLLNMGSINQVFPFPLPTPRLEAHLYWHESVEADPANRWLREQIENVLTSPTAASGPSRMPGDKRPRAIGRDSTR